MYPSIAYSYASDRPPCRLRLKGEMTRNNAVYNI